MHLLVTGATGFVGNVLLDRLPGEVDWETIRLLALPGDPGGARLARRGLRSAEVVEGDVRNARQVDAAVRGRTHVIHLAGLISYWGRDRKRLDQVNRLGVQHVVDACLRHGVRRLVHVSSVGAIGFLRDGRPAAEDTPFNWPQSFHYMTTKLAGQRIVEEAARQRGLQAVILNPASVMGPGDPDPRSAHNRLVGSIHRRPLFGCFAGGLAVTDVRDLAALAIRALSAGGVGERYLVVGANVEYAQVVRAIGGCFGQKVHPFRVPPPLLAAAGRAMEAVGAITGRCPPLTHSYGKLSGWFGYYSNRKSVETFRHEYLPFERTIADDCRYYVDTYCGEGGCRPS